LSRVVSHIEPALPVKVDETDVRILKALMQDGRKPLRQIAKVASVSTPTVESRIRKMFETGLIRKIAPIIDVGKIEQGVFAVVRAKTSAQKLPDTAQRLASFDKIRNVYTITGENNLLFTVLVDNLVSLQDFLGNEISMIEGISVTSYDVVTKVIKDEPGAPIRPGWGVRLFCDQCGAEVKGEPITLKVGDIERFFCCKTCQAAYKERYGPRILKFTRQSKEDAGEGHRSTP
jgi:DNA-binding Lrp family transcriptional regulator/ribosomal protein L24E